MARSRLAIALALALGCTALTGAAFAGPPDDPGKSENAPGQQKKAEAPAPAPAATPPASPGKSASAPGKTKTGKAATPKGKSAQVRTTVTPAGHDGDRGKSGLAHQRVIVCHWAAHKWVLLNVPKTSSHFRNKHPDVVLRDNPDVDPGDKASDFDLSVADCGAPPEGEVLVTEEKKEEGCPPVTTVTKTTTETKVEHKAGRKGKVVEISPSDKSAHVRKHGEKKTVVTKTETKVVAQGDCPSAVVAAGAPGQPAAAVTPAAEEAVGEVKGVQARIPAKKAKPAGGVLGRLGAVAGRELPFTGLPLWIVALIGVGFVGAGFGARKAMR